MKNFIDTNVGKNNININGTSYEIKLSPVEKEGVVYLPEDGARKICEYFGKDGAVDGFISQKQFIDISGNKYISFEKIVDTLGKGKFKVFYDKETGLVSACMLDFANSWYMK